MPARRIGDGGCVIRLFDVVGRDSATIPEFTRHVGLAAEGRSAHGPSDALPWEHMGPPLLRGDWSGPVHSLGMAGLSVDQIRQIRLFIDELENEYEGVKARSQYVVAPHVRDEKADDGTTKHRQFSCAGFVIEAYREAAIDLLTTEVNELPDVGLNTLLQQYPDQERVLLSPLLRRKVGLDGDGPWPVVLAGHVLNSLARSEPEIRSRPYRPEVGDEFFPTRRV